MILAYAVILVGGLLITARLGLLADGGDVLAHPRRRASGVLAASGHCMVARWAFAPVCGFDYWRVIVTSPEVLIFLFFMITDPKTVPTGRVGRIVFGFLVAVASTLLMAPQTTEFGTKVALLGGLAVVCAGRPILDRLLPARLGDDGPPVRDGGRGAAPAPRSGACSLVLRARARRRHRRGGRARRAATSSPTAADVLGPGAARSRPGDVPLDHRRAGRPRLEPRDHRRGRAGDRARPSPRTSSSRTRRCCGPTRRSWRPSTTATGWTRCARGSRPRPATARRTVDRYQIDDINVTLLVPFGKQDGLEPRPASRVARSRPRPTTTPAARAGPDHGAVRQDLRDAAGHWRPLAQRGGAADTADS